jgi:hypothetical protein
MRLAKGLRYDVQTNEATMHAIIDLNTELLVDRSRIGNPYLRLLLTAIGQELAKGSPWVAVNKKIALQFGLAEQFLAPQAQAAA